MSKNNYATINKAFWENEVKGDCGFTKPWLDLDVKILQKFAKGELKNPPEPLNEIFPIKILSNIKNKEVLCLASGGGQQSAIFALLGANVTVVDITNGQLEGDEKAAKHYGYNITTIQADMSNLTMLKNNSFDIVYQAPSMTYIPNVKKVYFEVARVLKNKGLYRADAQNPQAFHYEDWDGKGYRISKPYVVKEQKRSGNENVLEYRHYLNEIFNGLIECGLVIEQVEEIPKNLYQTENDEPGSWGHTLKYIPGIFCILAKKK